MRPAERLVTPRGSALEVRRVRHGETVVAFGADVVLETEPLERGTVLAVLDVAAAVGALSVPAAADPEGFRREFERFRRRVPRSLLRAGADRRRLRFFAAGGERWLWNAFGQGTGGPTPRVIETGGVVAARLELGRGRFLVEVV